MSTSPNEIRKWKSGAAARCNKKLFKSISTSEPEVTYMSRILEKVFPDSEKASDTSIAFAISVCEALLSPRSENIQINEETLKTKLRKNLVNLRFCVKKLISS